MLATGLVFSAVLLSLLRASLPYLNQYHDQVIDWLVADQGLKIEAQSIDAGWHKSGPVLIINSLDVDFNRHADYDFAINRIKISIDFWNSLLSRRLVLNNLILDGAELHHPLTPFAEPHSEPLPNATVKADFINASELASTELQQWAQLTLRQFKHFELTNSSFAIINPSGDEKHIHIRELAFVNDGNRHRGEGWAYINDDAGDNNLRIMLDVTSAERDLTKLSGQIYLQAENMSVSGSLQQVLSKRLTQSTLNASSWIDINDNQLTGVLVQLQPSKLSWQYADKQQQLDIWGGYLQWQRTAGGWQLDSQDLALVSNGIVWPALTVQLRQQDNALLLAVNQLELANLTPLATLMTGVDAGLLATLSGLNPQGLVNDIKVKVPQADWQQLSYQFNLQDLQLQSFQGIPGFNHLDGQFRGRLNSGAIDLTMADAKLAMAGHLSQDLQVNSFTAAFNWQRYGSAEQGTAPRSEQQDQQPAVPSQLQASRRSGIEFQVNRLQLDTPELVLDSQLLLDIPAQQPAFLSLAGALDIRDASKAHYYYPPAFMGEALIDYLQLGLQQGHATNGQLLWYGEFANYPFSAGDGIFQARVNVEDATFAFAPDWPSLTNMQLELLFDNADLFMSSRQANLDQVELAALDGQLLDLTDAQLLTIQAKFASTGAVAKSLLDVSPLPNIAKTLDAVQVSGNISGHVDLSIPFTEAPVAVTGEIALLDDTVYLPATKMTLTGVNGSFGFKDDELTSLPITAQLWDQPLNLSFSSASRGDDYQVKIDLSGDWQPRQLLAANLPQYQDYISGSAHWQGALDMLFKSQGYHYQLDINSDLNRVLLALPQPLSKRAGNNWPSHLSVVGNDKQAQVQIKAADKGYFTGQFNYADGKLELIQSLLQIGNSDSLLRSDAANAVVIKVAELNLADWHRWYLQLPKTKIDMATSVTPLSSVTLAVANTAIQDQPVNNLRVTARKGYRNWQLSFKADEFNGSAVVPDSGNINVDFDYIYLPELQLNGKEENVSAPVVDDSRINAAASTLRWQDVPDFNFNCSACIVGNMNLGSVYAAVSKDELGLDLTALDINMGHSSLKASGRWTGTSPSTVTTRWQGQLKTDSVEQMVTSLGQVSPLAKTPAQLTFALSWLGDPLHFDRQSLAGQVSLDAKGGRILSVSDKGTRFLSIFSLQSLVNKLSLDFSDVFNDGLPYSAMRGTAKISDGIITNNDFLLNSNSGKVTGQGSFDLVTEQINYNLSFFPDVTSSLPLLTAFAVTPTTALAVFALSKILEPVVEVITELKFNISGDLENPVFTEVQRNQEEIKVPNKLIKAVESAVSLVTPSAATATPQGE